MTTTIENVWTELEAEARGITSFGVLKRILTPEFKSTIYLGIQTPSLSRLFLFELPRHYLPEKETILQFQGLETTVQLTGEETNNHATFVLRATTPAFNEVFSSMAEDLRSSVAGCQSEQDVPQVFLGRLQQWQDFFKRNGINGMSDEAQRGLYGELYFLKKYLLLSVESHMYAKLLSSWTGAKNRKHDFQFGRSAVEVKTVSSKQHQKLFVSSEQQLDESQLDRLFLYHLSLSPVENLQDTLPAIIDGIRNVIHESYPASSIFEASLVERGYLGSQSWRYRKTGYTVREENFFHVVDGFPRLTERDLPHGVGDITYSIAISECKRFSVDVDDVMANIRNCIA